MGVVFTHDIANDFGAFTGGPVVMQAHLMHAKQDATVHGFEAIADVRQGAPDDDAHGVIEVAAADLVLDINRDLVASAAKWKLSTAAGRRWWGGFGAASGRFGILLICQQLLLKVAESRARGARVGERVNGYVTILPSSVSEWGAGLAVRYLYLDDLPTTFVFLPTLGAIGFTNDTFEAPAKKSGSVPFGKAFRLMKYETTCVLFRLGIQQPLGI